MDSPDIYDLVAKASPVSREGPRGWIQWKGTSVCCDIVCGCGADLHLDADFAYTIKCPKCHEVYGLDPNITLVHIPEGTKGYWYENPQTPMLFED